MTSKILYSLNNENGAFNIQIHYSLPARFDPLQLLKMCIMQTEIGVSHFMFLARSFTKSLSADRKTIIWKEQNND